MISPKPGARVRAAQSGLVAPRASDESVDAFIDALWLEEGLSKNTLEAYRRDLNQLFAYRQGAPLLLCTEADLLAYFSAQHATTKATTSKATGTTTK